LAQKKQRNVGGIWDDYGFIMVYTCGLHIIYNIYIWVYTDVYGYIYDYLYLLLLLILLLFLLLLLLWVYMAI
jgi:hypothetical protein